MRKIVIWLLLSIPILASAQWNYLSTPSYLNGTFAVSSDSNVFYSYEAKHIHFSHNGGLNWSAFETEYEFEFIVDMDFVNDSVGYLCGGGWFSPHRNLVMRTTNAGQSWETLTRDSLGTYQFIFSKVDFVSADSGMVLTAYGNELFRTMDGGSSWQQTYYDSMTNFSVSDIYFVNGSLGFITTIGSSFSLSKATIFKTTDFGATWLKVKEWDDEHSFLKIHFNNENVGYVGGSDGRLFRTTDGGTTWTDTYIAPGNSISALWFTNDNTGYSNALGTIHKTSDEGTHWTTQLMSPLNIVEDIQFAPSGNVGYLKAGNLLYKTTNGGGTTSIQNPSLHSQFKIYPNPTSGILKIDYENDVKIQSIQLTDVAGRVVKIFSKNEKTLNVSGLPSSVYFLNIQAEEGSVTEKIIIQ